VQEPVARSANGLRKNFAIVQGFEVSTPKMRDDVRTSRDVSATLVGHPAGPAAELSTNKKSPLDTFCESTPSAEARLQASSIAQQTLSNP
jgi:hypothetical protein